MICSSGRIVRVITRPFIGPDSDRRWRKIRCQVSPIVSSSIPKKGSQHQTVGSNSQGHLLHHGSINQVILRRLLVAALRDGGAASRKAKHSEKRVLQPAGLDVCDRSDLVSIREASCAEPDAHYDDKESKALSRELRFHWQI